MPRRSTPSKGDLVEFFKNSPIHGVRATEDRDIRLDSIEEDPTNPGSDKHSKRYDRRDPSMRDSFDILGENVYPVIVTKIGDDRYMLIDGHGRFHEAKRRGLKTISAKVFPQMTDEQRILARQVLGAAQEPFDTVLVLKDLLRLAQVRGLDFRDDKNRQTLLRDLPEGVRKHESKLKVLAKWPTDAWEKISVDESDEDGVLGFDKLKELDGLVDAIKNRHEEAAAQYEGEKLYRQILKLYTTGAFRDGGIRSQEAIRHMKTVLKKLPANYGPVRAFLAGRIKYRQFADEAESEIPNEEKKLDKLCKSMNSILTDLDPDSLSPAERRSLKMTLTMLKQFLVATEDGSAA
jgi:hypothetical protein